MTKRSVTIRGHSTSFSLEDEFWLEIKAIAKDRKISVAQLVTRVDATRNEGQNLSSALRITVLQHLKKNSD